MIDFTNLPTRKKLMGEPTEANFLSFTITNYICYNFRFIHLKIQIFHIQIAVCLNI